MRPQKVLVVMEAEFWYLLFALAKRRGAKTVLINARMSDRSFPKYQKMGWLYRQIFKHIDEVYAQTHLDKERLEALGAKDVVVTGNIKLASLPKVTHRINRPQGVTVCAASTHAGEESLILDAFGMFKKEHPEAKLILVPRHPERFGKVAAEVEAFARVHAYSWHRYAVQSDLNSDITLVDTLGELVNIYAVSDIVILGGSFVPVGGHNAAEAAQFGCRIISGPHYFNQRDIYEAIEGIAVTEDFNLASRLLQYEMILPAKRKFESDLHPIIRSIEAAVPFGEGDA
jgi:3-deoxy-D-manno-octulosonic-acid transferase